MITIARREDGALLVVASNVDGPNPAAEIHLDGGVWRTTVQSALARGSWVPSGEKAVTAHLRGLHDQKDHGRKRRPTAAPPAPEASEAPKAPQLAKVTKKATQAKKRAAPKRAVPRPDRRIDAGTNRLRQAIDSGVKRREKLSGGHIAETELVEFNDGTRAVRKVAKDKKAASAVTQQDAEELSASVIDALGLPVPAVFRSADNEVFMEYVDAKPQLTTLITGEKVRGFVNSKEGILVGLADIITDNRDRHAGNWLIDKDQTRFVPIDHGYAHTWDNSLARPDEPMNNFAGGFSSHFIDSSDGFAWKPNPLTRADAAALRPKLEALEAEFKRLNRSDWFRNMMTRFDQIAGRANGEVNVYA